MTPEELAALLMETGQHHHHAYIDSNGVDPEWALWYAGFLQSRIWDRAGAVPTRSSIVHLLVEGDKQYNASEQSEPWPLFYAKLMLASFAEG